MTERSPTSNTSLEDLNLKEFYIILFYIPLSSKNSIPNPQISHPFFSFSGWLSIVLRVFIHISIIQQIIKKCNSPLLWMNSQIIMFISTFFWCSWKTSIPTTSIHIIQ
eukprot:154252_1